MHQCNQCNQQFLEEPYYSVSDNSTYCSEECIPEESIDQTYSFEYFNLVSSYRHFVEEKKKVERLTDREDLENEMDLVIEEYKSIYFGDSEGHYYKARILSLYEKLLQLYDEVHNCLLQNDEIYNAVIICWDELYCSIGAEQTGEIYNDILEEINFEYFEYKNLSWEARNESEISPANFKDIISFDNTDEQERFINILNMVFAKYENKVSKKSNFNSPITEMFYCQTIKKCPVCGYWENVDDFIFDQEFNVHICNQNSECRI